MVRREFLSAARVSACLIRSVERVFPGVWLGELWCPRRKRRTFYVRLGVILLGGAAASAHQRVECSAYWH